LTVLLHECFSGQASHTPRLPAVLDGDRSITYEELGSRVDRVASGLLGHRIGQGSLVGLHMERSIDWITSALAILRANAAVVPLPPSFPPARLADIVRFAGFDAVIEAGGSRLDSTLPGVRLSLEDLLSTSGGAEAPPGNPDQPAFVLCSSGSTGRPKMIVRSHRSFFHRLNWTWREHPYAPDEVCCQKSHMTTTHAIYELFEPLLKGAPVVVIQDSDVRNLETFWDLLLAHRVTRLLIVPSQLQASLGLPGFTPPPLRVVVLMGEYVSLVLAERALAAFPEPTRVYSIYGSTEASSTLVCDLRRMLREGQELPLGYPIDPEVRPVVLAADGRPAAPGQSGRLHIGGPALFSGYFRDSEGTAAAFTGDALYDTGDEVRLTADGALEFIGRADKTIKVRGYRVDLREVEGALLLHPQVRQAAVVGAGEGPGADRLLAFITPASVDCGSVFEALRARLPEYMVPATLIALEALPLTASGKADRRRLLEMHAEHGREVAAHRDLSATERRVAEVWARVLNEAGRSPDVSFFEAGGTSLSAFSLIHQLREAFGLDRDALNAQAIYRSPTITALAAHLDHVLSGAGATPEHSSPTLVTLRAARDPARSPLFLVASAGGALGSYEKLARMLTTPREIIGVRDPFLWGARSLSDGFDRWVDHYLDAIRERQPSGPYHVVAYSSAGAFGYEIARRLRLAGEEVPLLVLIDPLALDRRTRWRYGWWALRATWARPHLRALIRLVGWLRRKPLSDTRAFGKWANTESADVSAAEPEGSVRHAGQDSGHLALFSAVLELNTGLPFTLEPEAFDRVPAEGRMGVLLDRARELTPEMDPQTLERIALQYPLQVRAQHAYQLRPYDGRVLLVEAATRYAGLLRVLLRPYVRRLEAIQVKLGTPAPRVREVADKLGALGSHYRSMRDDTFVRGLAAALDSRLD
jgi:amino acid adenylation domain-containing protein